MKKEDTHPLKKSSGKSGKDGQTERIVISQDPIANAAYPKNHVTNTKYTILTFLPKNIKEQFSRPINMYFLLIACLQLFSELTPVNPLTTWGPLIFAFTLTAVKEGYDDYLRYKSDKIANERQFVVIHNGEKKTIPSNEICVGDIIYLRNDTEIPCDLVLLGSSDESGTSYIQTANLDGETDLKTRIVLPELVAMHEEGGIKALESFAGKIECATPNADVYKFDSRLFIKADSTEAISMTSSNMLLQSTHLRNTDWVYGVAVYTGNETKCGMNKRDPPSKWTKADRFVNMTAVYIFGFQLLIVIGFGIAGNVLKDSTGRDSFYLNYYSKSKEEWYQVLVIPLRFLLLCSLMIPISLKVTLDLARYYFAWMINWDVKMYDEETDIPAHATNTALSEDLAQIEYVLTDKTGTLTENEMLFKKCTIAGNSMTDEELKDLAAKKRLSPEIVHFFRGLALCHSVVPVEKGGEIEYRASSPDEEALVLAAASIGVILLSRDAHSITIRVLGNIEKYETLECLEFTSTRKRMGVLMRDMKTGKVHMFEKGADDVILSRLNAASASQFRTVSTQHLQYFAQEGLRTLCVAHKVMDPSVYSDWKREYHEANTSIENRDALLEAVYAKIECEFNLIGASAIEDRLQDRVPQTIADLRDANIRFWMLTGDKYETAIQIGHSCNLITRGDRVITLNGETELAARESMHRARIGVADPLNPHQSGGRYVVVVRGTTLQVILASPSHAEEFLKIGLGAIAVICCRVTPGQKAHVVRLVKEAGHMTLSIGDGGNDVSMIQEAHVGVGISGKEGLQAARAADYSIGKFRHLKRLLLVHGHYSYERTSFLAQYSYYKSFIICLVQLFFNMYTLLSGTTFFNSLSLMTYNVFFTFLPTFFYVLDRSVESDVLMNEPKVYEFTQKGGSMTLVTILMWYARALFQSAIMFFFTIGIYSVSYTNPDDASPMDYDSINSITFTILIAVQTLTVLMESNTVTAFNDTVIWGCYIFYWIFVFIYSLLPTSDFYTVMFRHVSDAVFWMTYFLCTIACMIPVIALKYVKVWDKPSMPELIRTMQKNGEYGEVHIRGGNKKYHMEEESIGKDTMDAENATELVPMRGGR